LNAASRNIRLMICVLALMLPRVWPASTIAERTVSKWWASILSAGKSPKQSTNNLLAGTIFLIIGACGPLPRSS
jgi:hypothetical protein